MLRVTPAGLSVAPGKLPRCLETSEAIARQAADQLGVHPQITASLDRRTALQDADFVVNMVQVGGIVVDGGRLALM